MDLHGQIMNLVASPGLAMVNATDAQLICYRMGHRDARHAAAELALKADAEIDALRKDADRYRFIRDADKSDDLIPEIGLYAMDSLDSYVDAAMAEYAAIDAARGQP